MTEFVIYSMMENGRESGYHRKCFEIIQFLSSLMEISLFLVELGNSGGVARVVSFIVVGLLLLVIGYFHRYHQRIKLQQQKTRDRLESKERSFFR